MQDKGMEIWFRVDALTKTKRPSKPHMTLKWVQFEGDDRLDVVKCIRVYIHKMEQVRGKEDQLLISYVKPYRAVQTCTIARWLKCAMQVQESR